MARRFTAVPEVPDELLDWQTVMFSALKENVELLTGTRGESDLASLAIVRGDVIVNQLGVQTMHSINLSNNLTPTAFNECAPLDSFVDLRADVQTLANDLLTTRIAFDVLIRNLTGA